MKEIYSFAYAVFRLSATLKNAELQAWLMRKALALFIAGLENNSAKGQEIVNQLEYLLGFGRDVGIIHPHTTELMLAELGKIKFDSAKTKITEPPLLSKEDLFPTNPAKLEEVEFGKIFDDKVNSAIAGLPNAESESDSGSDGYNIRKIRILERIRQSGNCRLRDILEVMDGVSERTLRYDLQRLTTDGLLEKVGNSGPATFYRIRQSLS